MRNTIALAAVAMLAAPWAVTHAQEDREQHAEARVGSGGRDVGGGEVGGRAPGDRDPGDTARREERLSGTFELAVPRARAEAQVNRAIEEAVSHMSWFKRGFATSRLREKNPVRETLRTEVRGDTVTIAYGDATYSTREGQWQTVTATGEQVQLLQQIVGDRIYQTFRSEDGEKLTVYSPSDDGSRMDLDITVTSPQLPVPLRYELSYRRAGGGAVASR